jgi:hypothetical protein
MHNGNFYLDCTINNENINYLVSMTNTKIDLKLEQQNTLDTPAYSYTFSARAFFWLMDITAGSKNTLSKAKLLEILASIPYRAWEMRNYMKQTRQYKKLKKIRKFNQIIEWSREAQDNEYTHLLVIDQKMAEDGMKDKWYLSPFVTFFVVLFYIAFARLVVWFNPKRAFMFNAEFENHAERVYANMVRENPGWEEQKITNEFIKSYADVDTWADVVRRIGLDERDHMNHSFIQAGELKYVHKYSGMPYGVTD